MIQPSEKKVCGSPKEVAELFSIPVGTLANMRCCVTGPKYYKRGKKVYYLYEDILAWIQEHPVKTNESL